MPRHKYLLGIKLESGEASPRHNNKTLRYEAGKMGIEPPNGPNGWRKWGEFLLNALRLLRQVEKGFGQ
jgi:hypothetical protein